MANVSSSNGLEKRPKLRFPGFDEPWKDTLFSDLYEAANEKSDGSFGVESIISVANMYFKEDARITDEGYLKTYNIFKVGDIAFEGNKSNDFSHGRFVENTIGDGIVSHVFVVFKPLHDTHNLRYWKYAINNESVMGRILARCTKKTTMMTNLVTKDFLNQSIPCPSAQEQDKIANLLDTISKRIELQKLYVESLKKYKRGLHKLVFIKNRKPSWEKSALHDIASFCGGGTPSKDVSSYWDGEIGWISSSDIQEEWIDDISVTRRITKKAIDNSATKLCPEGTIAIVSRVGVGKVAIIPESLCTSQDFTNITSITGNTHYMAYQIAFRMKLEAMKTQGTSIKGVTADTIKSMVLDIPPLEEQKKIADMLTAFDSYIKRAVYELDLFITMKKALLQQLFI